VAYRDSENTMMMITIIINVAILLDVLNSQAFRVTKSS